MSERKRFTALIGWLDRPTIDGRRWQPADGTVGLRSPAIPLRMLPRELAVDVLVGYINKVTIHSGGAVYASGKADPAVADALNDGTSILLADLPPGDRFVNDAGELCFSQVMLMAARVGTVAQFAWREAA